MNLSGERKLEIEQIFLPLAQRVYRDYSSRIAVMQVILGDNYTDKGLLFPVLDQLVAYQRSRSSLFLDACSSDERVDGIIKTVCTNIL